jgi:O-methyltransferase
MTVNAFLWKLSQMLSDVYFILRFLKSKAGKEYGITPFQKIDMLLKIKRNQKLLKSFTTWQQQLLLVQEVFSVPKSLKGDVIEWGCYNGASTAILSLACALTKRRLYVCDSFEGFPEPDPAEKYEIHGHSEDYYIWERGEFSSEGGLEQVKRNIEKFGDISVCTFVKGFFKDTLRELNTESLVLVFEDADIESSVRDCLLYLWPKLQYGCKFFCHEAWSINVVSLFYDKKWWNSTFATPPPGFYGSGYGILAGTTYANIGYAKKFDPDKIKETGKKLVH